ncbi:MAG: MFS transporter [Cohnella sp.]|nr:MFS transporter [Cohnella sp.]
MLYVVLPIYWKEVGLTSLWEVGVLLSINRLVRLPLNPLIGWMYNRMSLRSGLIGAILLGTVTTLGYGVAHGFAMWLLLRIVWGIAWSLIRMGGFFTVIGFAGDSNRGHAMGRYNGLSRLGSLVGMFAGGTLVAIVGLQPVSLLFGFMSLVAFVLTLLALPHDQKVNASKPKLAFGELAVRLRSAPVMLILAGGFIISLLFAILSATLSIVIDKKHGHTVQLFGLAAGSTSLSGALLAAKYGWDFLLGPKIGRKSDEAKSRLPYLLASLVCSGVGYAFIPWHIPLTIWLVVVMLVMVASTAITTLMDTVATDVAKSSIVVAVMTAYSVVTDLGAALGPIVGLGIIEATDEPVYVYLGAAALTGLTAIWFSRMRRVPSRENESGRRLSG